MKNFLFSLIVLTCLTFSNVGLAFTDVSTEKTQTELLTQAETLDVLAVYEMVNKQAPEVFTEDAGGTKVTLYGIYKAEAFKYLTEQKNAKNIFTGDCLKDEKIAFSVCRNKQSTRDHTIATSGQINSISKKWIWCI